MEKFEVDPLEISETFDLLKNIRILEDGKVHDEINFKVKVLLTEFAEHMENVSEIGHTEILNEYYKLLNSYVMNLKKIEVSQILREADFVNENLNEKSFKVHFDWFTTQILGNFFFLKDIESIIPLMVRCLIEETQGNESPENKRLKSSVEKLFKQTFESFGHEKTKKFIEILLLNDKNYAVFFNWYYSKGFVDEFARPKTADGDFYRKEVKNEENDKNSGIEEEKKSQEVIENEDDDRQSILSDEFPLGDNYKVIESRPKTSEGFFMKSEAERKEDNFSLSQTDTNENNTQGNVEINEETKSNRPLGQFLTEEKPITTVESQLDSRFNEKSLNNPDFNTITEPVRKSLRLSELKSENIQERYQNSPNEEFKITEEVLQLLDSQKEKINNEWKQKLNQQNLLELQQEIENNKKIQNDIISEIQREHK